MKRGKAVAIAEEIRHDIRRKKYTERLPPDTELAEDFGVNPKTIALVMSRLEGEGLVTRRRRVGTMVCQPEEESTSGSVGTVVLMMRTKGHLFGELSGVLARRLQDHGYVPVLISTSSSHGEDDLNLSREEIQELVSRACEQNPVAIYLDGMNTLMLAATMEMVPSHVRLVCMSDTPPMGEQAALIRPDFKRGSYLATRHLLSLGRRRILHVAPLFELPPHLYPETSHYEFNMGYRQALDEAGLAGHEQFFFETHDRKETAARLLKLMSAKDRPDAILAFGDFRCVNCLRVLRQLKLEVPRDVALFGYYNTPWCEASHPQLSSVDIDLDAIARAMLTAITSEQKPNRYIVAPRLVFRESAPAIEEGP